MKTKMFEIKVSMGFLECLIQHVRFVADNTTYEKEKIEALKDIIRLKKKMHKHLPHARTKWYREYYAPMLKVGNVK